MINKSPVFNEEWERIFASAACCTPGSPEEQFALQELIEKIDMVSEVNPCRAREGALFAATWAKNESHLKAQAEAKLSGLDKIIKASRQRRTIAPSRQLG